MKQMKRITLRLSLENPTDKKIADFLANIDKNKYHTVNNAIKTILFSVINDSNSKSSITTSKVDMKEMQAIEECEGIVRENNDLKDKLYSAETIAEQTDKQLSKALVDNKNLLSEIVRFKSSLSEKDKKIYELSEQLETERRTSKQAIEERDKRIIELTEEYRLITEKYEAIPKIFRKNP